uniref:Uncharacterized protein n=1 Tax=Salix viminalis TaxID=40686 RepID=A0A6N2M050_SALVM
MYTAVNVTLNTVHQLLWFPPDPTTIHSMRGQKSSKDCSNLYSLYDRACLLSPRLVKQLAADLKRINRLGVKKVV